MMRSLTLHVSMVTSFTRYSLNAQRVNYIQFGIRQYQSVCGAANYHVSYNRNQYSNLDKRLLASKPHVIHRPFSVEFHCLQKYTSNLRSDEEVRLNNQSYEHTFRNVYPLSKCFYSTSSEKETSKSAEPGTSEEAQKKLTLVQRFKAMLKDYWHILVPVHVITSVGWIGAFYYLATSGIDIPALMESLNFSESFVKPFRDSSMGYYAVSYGLYKIATPARYAVTVGGTSIAIRVLKKRGLVQPWPINLKWLSLKKKKEP